MNFQSDALFGVLSRIPPRGVAALLLIVTLAGIAWQGYESYQALFSEKNSEAENSVVGKQLVKPEVLKRDLFDARQLVSMNVFGQPSSVIQKEPKREEKPALDVDRLKETKLDLVLKGAFMGASSDVSHALISSGRKKKSERFEVNDKVQSGVTLYAIHVDSVVLKRGKKLEVLSFKRDIGEGSSVISARSERSRSRRNEREISRTHFRGSEQQMDRRDMNSEQFVDGSMSGMSDPMEVMGQMGFSSPEELIESFGGDIPEGLPSEMMEAIRSATRNESEGMSAMSKPENIRDRLRKLREMRERH